MHELRNYATNYKCSKQEFGQANLWLVDTCKALAKKEMSDWIPIEDGKLKAEELV